MRAGRDREGGAGGRSLVYFGGESCARIWIAWRVSASEAEVDAGLALNGEGGGEVASQLTMHPEVEAADG